MNINKLKNNNGFLNNLARGYDALIGVFSPTKAAQNFQARTQLSIASDYFNSPGGFDSADRSSRDMGAWTPYPTDADSAMYGLDDIRSRSRDAVRNQPIAGGIVNTTIMNTVGVGLSMQSHIDRELLGLTDDEADAWQKHTERRWKLWANSKDCDIERKLNFNAHTQLTLRSRCVNGEALTLLPIVPLKNLPNPLRLQSIESDRLSNPNNVPDTQGFIGGIEKDQWGAPVKYWIQRGHPGNVAYPDSGRCLWDAYEAFNKKTGLPNVIHYFRMERPGQTRGIPMLAGVLEQLIDVQRMSKAELKRAVVSALFTVFVKSAGNPLGNMPFPVQNYGAGMSSTTGINESAATTGNIKLGYGSVIGLDQGQDIVTADPNLPNANFDPFWQSCVRQIGLQIGIPYEVVIKHYTSSYSASKAALEDAYSFFITMRSELIENHCNPIYNVWLAQEVAQGTIYAPGFFSNDMIRAAWSGNEWIGPSKMIIDPVKEVAAAKARAELAITTLSQETASITGGDWDVNIIRRGKEEKLRRLAGLIPDETAQPAMPPPQQQPEPSDPLADDNIDDQPEPV